MRVISQELWEDCCEVLSLGAAVSWHGDRGERPEVRQVPF